MIRRSRLAVIHVGALLLGTYLGAATGLPRAHAKSVDDSVDQAPVKKELPPGKEGDKDKGKGGAGAHCKVTRDCQSSYVCSKVGDHKECTATTVKVPESPVVT